MGTGDHNCGGLTLRWTTLLMLPKTELSASLMGFLAHMWTLPFLYPYYLGQMETMPLDGLFQCLAKSPPRLKIRIHPETKSDLQHTYMYTFPYPQNFPVDS